MICYCETRLLCNAISWFCVCLGLTCNRSYRQYKSISPSVFSRCSSLGRESATKKKKKKKERKFLVGGVGRACDICFKSWMLCG